MRKKIKRAVISAMCLSFILVSPVIKIRAKQGVDVTKTDAASLEGATDIVYEGGILKGVTRPGSDPIAGTYFSSDKDSLPIPNNGGYPVLDKKGGVVSFTLGDDKGYLMYIGKNNWKPYVSGLKIVRAQSKKEAAESLIKKGCSYYIDKNYSDGKDYLMIGYMRTEDEGEAITDIIGLGTSEDGGNAPLTADVKGYEKASDEKIAGHVLYVSRDSSIGNPICDLDAFGEASDITVEPKVLANLRLSRSDVKAKQYITDSDGYKSFIESDEEYIIKGVQTPGKTDIGISLASKKEGLKEKDKKKSVLLSTYFTASSSDGQGGDKGKESDAAEDASEDTAEPVDEKDAQDITDIGGEIDVSPSDEDSGKSSEGTEFDTQTDETYENAPMTSDGTGEYKDDTEGMEGMEGTILNVLGGTGATVFFVVILGVAVVIPIAAFFINKEIKKDKKER